MGWEVRSEKWMVRSVFNPRQLCSRFFLISPFFIHQILLIDPRNEESELNFSSSHYSSCVSFGFCLGLYEVERPETPIYGAVDDEVEKQQTPICGQVDNECAGGPEDVPWSQSRTIELRNYCDEDAYEYLVRPRVYIPDPNLIENYEKLGPNHEGV